MIRTPARSSWFTSSIRRELADAFCARAAELVEFYGLHAALRDDEVTAADRPRRRTWA
jgi:hypothetical protein